MPSLAIGSSGADVIALQKSLTKAGFDPGGTDGNFGPQTADAVKGFQAASGLVADGKAGAKTLAALAPFKSDEFSPAPNTTAPFSPVQRGRSAGDLQGNGSRLPASFSSRGTTYMPTGDLSSQEGGPVDRRGFPIHTLQQFLEGKAPYVSVAMDGDFQYGQRVRIASLEAKFGRPIDFRLVDTGGAFQGRGTDKIDVAVNGNTPANRPDRFGIFQHMPEINRGLQLERVP